MNKKGKIDRDYVVLALLIVIIIATAALAIRDLSSNIKEIKYNRDMCEELGYTNFTIIREDCMCFNMTEDGEIVGQQFNDLLQGEACKEERR